MHKHVFSNKYGNYPLINKMLLIQNFFIFLTFLKFYKTILFTNRLKIDWQCPLNEIMLLK